MNETKWEESASHSSFFHLSRNECVINRYVENTSKYKTVDTAKLKKRNIQDEEGVLFFFIKFSVNN